jgi:hypothetical protein
VHPVEFAVPETADPVDVLHDTAVRRQAEPDRGIGYGILAYLAEPATSELFAARPPSPVIFSYVGLRQYSDGGLGSLSDVPGGSEIHPDFRRLYPVIVYAEIADGIVTTRINRRSADQGGEQDCRLADIYAAILAELAACTPRTMPEAASGLPM